SRGPNQVSRDLHSRTRNQSLRYRIAQTHVDEVATRNTADIAYGSETRLQSYPGVECGQVGSFRHVLPEQIDKKLIVWLRRNGQVSMCINEARGERHVAQVDRFRTRRCARRGDEASDAFAFHHDARIAHKALGPAVENAICPDNDSHSVPPK